MEKEHKQYTRRIRNLVFIFVITAILVTVSTYAWFIGMRTVNVSPFEIDIKAADSLALSLDGITFAESVVINKDTFKMTDTYSGNTNWWTGTEKGSEDNYIGLIPMSSVGQIHVGTSRLELYEKASMTPTPGGYRMISTKAENEGETEAPGYVAFDLFIKNFSGNDYIPEYNVLDEEDIYLTVDSAVKVDSVGGIAGTGIENSVRVAFAQIGRISGHTDTTTEDGIALVQGIDCDGLKDSEEVNIVTPICERTAQIWEPNDKDHVQGAINWYQTACHPRNEDGSDITKKESYDTEAKCNQITDGLAYPTYAMNSNIDASDNVDVYDGEPYNGYNQTTKLTPHKTFTDTDKLKEGTERPKFMSLAANSITKVRVYIYIEGQDIDNYDFAQIGKAISVQFGFTKQRLEPGDVGYTGPATSDKNPPIITINGFDEETPRVISLAKGETSDYIEDGKFVAPEATASIVTSGTGSPTTTEPYTEKDITIVNKVNLDMPGEYTVIYSVIGPNNTLATKTLKVIVTE
ncbi:MAG: hypothetical protein PHF21_01525 [Bacilli bacterium]|nr:hypothetical protein [Bacilli bacterium]